MKKLVSIIIPLHNAENTIDRCIESIMHQTYKNWEIICCDDCSTDDTISKLKKWKNQGVEIKLLENKKNMFAAYSRNRAFSCSNGEYIAQIDDDDYMAFNRLEEQVKFLNEHLEYDFVGSNMIYFDENGEWKKTTSKNIPKLRDFLKGTQFSNPSVMFRKECIQSIGYYRVAKETKRGQDYDLFMRLYANGYRGYNLDECLTYYYRGKSGYKKTNYRIRYDEFKVRWKNFKSMGLFPIGIVYALRPLIVGLIPFQWLERIKRMILAIKNRM